MAVVFKNNAKTTLAGNITNSATSITVTDGSIFPSLSGGDTFFCTLDDGTNNEIVSVTARSGNTLTVVRAQDSTTAKTFTAGDAAELRLTAGILNIFSQTGVAITDEIEAYLDANGTTFPDNVKAQFGTGNDLQIYHDGSHSYIYDGGVGDLKLQATNLLLEATDGTNYIHCADDGAVRLYYNGFTKLATTNTGIDVTGNISSGAINSTGNIHAGDSTNISMDSSANGQLEVDGNGYQGAIALDGNAMHLYHNSSARSLVLGTNETARLTISGTGGFDFESNPVQGITTLSSGAITSSSDVRADTHFNSTDTNATLSATGSGNVYLRPNGKSSTTGQVHIATSGNATFAGTITSGAISSSGNISSSGSITANSSMNIIGATGSSGYMYLYDRDNGTTTLDGFLLQKSGNHAYVYNRESAGKLFLGAGNTNSYLTIFSNGDYYAGSTKWFDQSRNLSNIGTISSGEITTTAPQFKYVSNTDSNVGLLIRDETYVSNEADITASRLASGSNLTLGLAGQVGINAYIGGVNKFSINSSGNATFAGTINSGAIISTGNLGVDGIIDNTRNNGNVSAPNTSDHTAGTRINFYDANATSWYAMGIENSTLWFNTDSKYKWYEDANLRMTLDGANLTVTGTVAATGGNSTNWNTAYGWG